MDDNTDELYRLALEASVRAGAHQPSRRTASLCRRILDAEPDHARAARLLGDQLRCGGRAEDAVDVLGAALYRLREAGTSDHRGILELTYALGLALHAAGRPADAARAFEELLDATFTLSGALALARCLLDDERFEDAFVLLSPLEADAVEGHNAELLLCLGRAMRAVGREDPATEVLTRAFEIDPEHAGVASELEALGFYAVISQGKAVLIPAECATPPGVPLPGWARPH